MTDHPFNLLLVDDDANVIAGLSRMLAEFGQLRFATSGADALRLARKSVPDLVLLDIEMPGQTGFEVCMEMREDPLLRDVPIIFITSHDSLEQEVKGLALGAVDFIGKPPRAPLVAARVRTHLRMKRMSDELRRAASIDGLTAVANRRQFDEMLAREWLRAQRACTPVSLLIADVDFFKAYNDQYGHQAGDRCLQSLASALGQGLLRPADLLARYGGEEFVVLLPETDAAGAAAVARRLLESVEAQRLVHSASTVSDHVTVSIGVSSHDQSCASWVGHLAGSDSPVPTQRPQASDLLAAADQALYAAKRSGRAHARFLSVDDVGAPERAVDLRPQRQEAATATAAPATIDG